MGLIEHDGDRVRPTSERLNTDVSGRVSRTLIGLLAVNILIELGLSLADAGYWMSPDLRPIVFYLGAFSPGHLHGMPDAFPGQTYTMFVTYAFLHGGLIHLALNMLALFLFGRAIIERVGTRRFVLAYAISILGGAVAFALLGNGITPMVGASGALFGLLGVWSCWDYLDKRFYRASWWETARPLVYLLLYNLAFMLLLQGKLAWEAHLGGFVTGWILALFWGRPIYRRIRARRRMARRTR